jgi:hypothetical protein
MHRFVMLVSIVALALASLATRTTSSVVTASVVTAQEVTPVENQHPIVGAWWWENNSEDAFDDSYAVFGADGTYVEETAYVGAGIGSWQPTGEDSGDLMILFQDIEGGLDPNAPTGFVPGTLKFWLSIEVSPDGNHLTATGPAEARKLDGTLEYAYTFNGTATRLGLDWVKPLATPTA